MTFPRAVVLAVACAASARAEDAPAIGNALEEGIPRRGQVRSKPCSGPEYRQFDFWLGEWDVAWVNGKPAGTNRIQAVLGGCALEESWRGARGTRGTSLNYFDPVSRRWSQLWIDDTGLVLRLEGGVENGSMVLAGDARGAKGSAARHRITWTPLPGPRVRQHWETSADGGVTWTTVFDGIYVRRGHAR